VYKHLDFSIRKDSFGLQIYLSLNENLEAFLENWTLNTQPFTGKKRKNGKIPYEQNKMIRNLIQL
jgi:hypothetical protein